MLLWHEWMNGFGEFWLGILIAVEKVCVEPLLENVDVLFDVWSLSPVQLFCDPMDYSPPGSSNHGILQARILEWVAISSSRPSFWSRGWTHSSWRISFWATREAPSQEADLLSPTSLWLWNHDSDSEQVNSTCLPCCQLKLFLSTLKPISLSTISITTATWHSHFCQWSLLKFFKFVFVFQYPPIFPVTSMSVNPVFCPAKNVSGRTLHSLLPV